MVHNTLALSSPSLSLYFDALSLLIDTFPNLPQQDCLVYKVAFTLSFACFLCSGKVVWDKNSGPAMILHVSNTKLSTDHAIVTLPALKTDPFQLGIKVVAPLVSGPKCPVGHLQCLLASHPTTAPLFGLGLTSFEPFTCALFVAILCCSITVTGLALVAYAGHSFRHSTATWAAHLGTSTDTIQYLGRWNSDCFCQYVNCTAGEHCDLLVVALFRVCNRPLVPDSTLWHDISAF